MSNQLSNDCQNILDQTPLAYRGDNVAQDSLKESGKRIADLLNIFAD